MRPQTCYCQQQSSQSPIFPSQAQDQSFTCVARNETECQKILDAADFDRRDNIVSFLRLNDAFWKTLLKCVFSTHTFQLDWEKIYLLPFKTTLDTKLREFQYKILNRILYTNKMLFKFKKVDSPLCDFCEKELETIEHLFFHCTKVSMFWNDLKSVLDSFNITIRFDIMNVLFGILDTDNISILVNYIILESKYFIYRCKLNKGCLCVRLLVDKFKKTFQTERFIAKRNNKICKICKKQLVC